MYVLKILFSPFPPCFLSVLHPCFPFSGVIDSVAQVHPFRDKCGKAKSRRMKAFLTLVSRPTPIIKETVLLTVGPRAVEPEPWSPDECWRGRMTPELNTRSWKPKRVRWIQGRVTTPRLPPLRRVPPENVRQACESYQTSRGSLG